MITVPVTIGFDQDKIIGSITLDESKLPALPEYSFSLGYKYRKDKDGYILMCVSLISDNNYMQYLQQKRGYE